MELKTEYEMKNQKYGDWYAVEIGELFKQVIDKMIYELQFLDGEAYIVFEIREKQ